MEDGLTYDMEWLRRLVQEASDLTAEARLESVADDDYYHGVQFTEAEKAVLRRRKQPDSVYNRIRAAINGTIGVMLEGETKPRAFSRNPQDDGAADVASKVLRYVADQSRFTDVRRNAARDYLVRGTCAVLCEMDDDGQVKLTLIRPEEFLYDPRSREDDFGDARHLGVAKWMYADDVQQMYPESAAEIDRALSTAISLDSSFDDRPTSTALQWVDTKNRRVLVIELYHRIGRDWYRCVFHAGGVLQKGHSPYLDAKGRTICPIEAQSVYVDRENNRYGVVRDMRGPQDGINKRSSKLLHLLSVSQVIAVQPGYEGDVEFIRAEAARPDGVLPYGWTRAPTSDMASGQFQLLQEAKAEIERMGPNPSILARQDSSASGRSVLARRQAGMTENAIIFAGIESWELRVYRQVWSRVKQFWRAPDFVRVTDDHNAPEFIGINQPVMGNAIVAGPDGQPVVAQVPVGVENELGRMDVDIILDRVGDTATLQMEQFQSLVELARSGVPIPPKVLIAASGLPDKQKLIEELGAGPDPMQERAMQRQDERQSAEISRIKSETMRNLSQVERDGAHAMPLTA